MYLLYMASLASASLGTRENKLQFPTKHHASHPKTGIIDHSIMQREESGGCLPFQLFTFFASQPANQAASQPTRASREENGEAERGAMILVEHRAMVEHRARKGETTPALRCHQTRHWQNQNSWPGHHSGSMLYAQSMTHGCVIIHMFKGRLAGIAVRTKLLKKTLGTMACLIKCAPSLF